MGVRVHRNRVRMRHRKRAYGDESLPVLTKDGDVSGFCRDIQLLNSRIEREYVRVFSDRICGQHLHVCEIDHCQLVIFLSRNKSQSSDDIEGNPMRALDSRDWIMPNNLGSSRINRYKFVLLMHRDEDVSGARVIDGITRTAVERDGGHQRVGRRIDHRIRVSMFVGYKDSLRTGSVGDAVRVFNRSSLCDGLECFHIDNGHFVLPGGRCIHSAQLRNCPDTVNVREAVEVCHNFAPSIKSGNQNWHTSYRGVSPEYFDIKRWYVDQGAIFSPEDTDRAADVCVIGRTVRDQLFGVESPIGKVMRVSNLPCKVVATLHPKGLSLSGQDQDDTIILPYTTAMKKIKGITWLDDILCSAVSADVVKMAGQEATAVLRDRHHLRPEEEDDFNIRNPEDIIQAQLDASKTLTILLIAIASVSLIVGGIGIMNVMLVSVTERTREIGVRVAVGATEAAIQLQFLGESIMLSLVGGAAGVVFGIFGSYLVGQTLGWPIEMSVEAVVVAAMFSIAVGVFFGYYPARKASRLDPIEALRYE